MVRAVEIHWSWHWAPTLNQNKVLDICVVVISPHHSRAISLQGKSDITLCRTDITLSRWYHQVIYTGYINYISPFLGIILDIHSCISTEGCIWENIPRGHPRGIFLKINRHARMEGCFSIWPKRASGTSKWGPYWEATQHPRMEVDFVHIHTEGDRQECI